MANEKCYVCHSGLLPENPTFRTSFRYCPECKYTLTASEFDLVENQRTGRLSKIKLKDVFEKEISTRKQVLQRIEDIMDINSINNEITKYSVLLEKLSL